MLNYDSLRNTIGELFDVTGKKMNIAYKIGQHQLAPDIRDWEHSESDKGEIYTRPEVVNFMLTAIGLNTPDDVKNARILEPACGEGEFVISIVDRLINLPQKRPTVDQLSNQLLAIDLVTKSLEITKKKVATLLSSNGYTTTEIVSLLDSWFLPSDFLLEEIAPDFSHVVGNPPYVRVENIPKKLLDEYRKQFSTMTGRADLYVPFYEKSLSLLKSGGKLSFICADRWTKNTYGRSLRSLISKQYSLELYVDLYGVEAFGQDVMTYPAITQIVNEKSKRTVLKQKATFSKKEAEEVLLAVNGEKTTLQTRNSIANNQDPWLFGSPDQLELIRLIEKKFPLIESTGCKIFIGAATGSNKVYVVDTQDSISNIEKDRLLPIITASEIKSGSINWRGKYLINTYDENGVINLNKYPNLSSYLHSYKKVLSSRHIAKKDSANWFKTIDRVYKDRAQSEKLLIPDISNSPIVIYDKGEYHPNNSIYYVCSKEWNLHALRAVLLSSITKLFISTYSTKIANGYLRYQAQHLRKLRLPEWGDIDPNLQKKLTQAGKNNNSDTFDELASQMYQLTKREKAIVGITSDDRP